MPSAVEYAVQSRSPGLFATRLHVEMSPLAIASCDFVDNGGNSLVILHQGHGPFDLWGLPELADAVLSTGADMLLMEMASIGQNWMLGGHPYVYRHPLPTPFYAHFYPVTACLNWALSQSPYDSAAMVGFSGGGWATTVYAALDDRIHLSIELMGSLPWELRTGINSLGNWDYEQSWIRGAASYEDFYALGADAAGRTRVQILNRYDQCCFARGEAQWAINGGYTAGYEALWIDPLNHLAVGEIHFEEVEDPGHRVGDDARALVLTYLQ